MNNMFMLTELSKKPKTSDDTFRESLEDLGLDELHKLSFALDPSLRTSAVSELKDKILQADASGRELAHENNVLDKVAFLPALAAGAARLAPLAGKAVGALGGAKGIIGGVAKDMAIGSAANKVIGALKPAAPAASAAGEVAGGFKYAFASNLLQKAVGYTVRNPGTALTAAGALGGAMMAPRDPQTGQKQYLRGAMLGGVGMAGVNALSNGSIANKMRASVLNRNNPLMGQQARQYMMDSAAAMKGKAPLSSSMRSQQVQYGPAAESIKVALAKRANQQTLTYDPSTKTFTRHHLTPSQGSSDLKALGASAIPVGHREAVRSSMARSRPMAFAARAL